MSAPPPLLVFDLDGTLADTAGDLVKTLNQILAREALPPVPVARAKKWVGAGARALIERGFAAAGKTLPEQRIDRLYGEFLAYYEAHICDESRLYPGVAAALDRFAADGFMFAVCTNKIEYTAVKLLDALGVGARFRAICGQDTFRIDDRAIAKPDPRFLLLTIAKAGGAAARSVMVGDSATDIATAKAAGVPVVAVDFGYADIPVAELGPDRVISHFDALWPAVAELMPAAAKRSAQVYAASSRAPHLPSS
jgi:phosphoglycolate phosphatase